MPDKATSIIIFTFYCMQHVMYGALQERLIKVLSQFKLSSSFWRHLSLRTCDLSTRRRVDIQQIKIQMQVELGDQLGIIQTDPGDEDLGGTKCLWLSGGKSRQPWKQGREHRYLDQTLAKQHSIWWWIDFLSFFKRSHNNSYLSPASHVGLVENCGLRGKVLVFNQKRRKP